MKSAKLCGVVCCLIAILVTPGCIGKYTGGGWIPSRDDAKKKATFGFSMEAVETDSGLDVSGQLQFNDHGAGTAFHAELTAANTGGIPNWGTFFGVYDPQPENAGDGGLIVVNVIDEFRAGGEDFIAVRLIGGVHDGYVNAGFVSRGNIKYHPPK